MKIGFVLDDSLDNPDGVQQYVLTLGTWLTSIGHEVHYLVGETNRADISNIHSLAKNIRVSFNQNKLSIPRPANKQKITKLLASENFDILHIQMPYSPQLVGRVISLTPNKTKIISTFHIYPASRIVNAGSVLLGKLTRNTIKKIDRCISVSQPAKTFMEKTYGVESTVIPNMINLSNMHLKNKQNNIKKKIVFLGRLVERKGAEQLINAFSLMNDTNSELIIGGRGALETRLKKLVKKLDLSDRVSFKGFISENHKPAFLNQADIAVFPSTGGESFGIVLLEAMASGAGVVIAGNNPGYASTLNNRQDVLFDPNNAKAFAEMLDNYLSDYKACVQIHAWQSELIKSYDVSQVGPKILAVYNKSRKAASRVA